MPDDPRALVPLRQQTVTFYGDALPAGQLADGTVLVPLRPICEALGLDWSAQRQRLNRDEVLGGAARSVVVTTTEGYPRPMLALPLDLLPGWLFGIAGARVKPALRERVLLYRRECFRVLWEAFRGEIVTPAPPTGATGAQAAVELARAVLALAEQQARYELQAGDHERRISALEVRLDPKQVLTEEQAAELALAVKTVGQRLARRGDRQGYAQVYSELYRRYRVASYKNLPQGKFAEVLAWLGAWAGELETKEGG